MQAKSDWAHLIPHQGSMCLLDAVCAWDDARIHARTNSHRRASNPLRRNGQLHAVHLCEYGAQAMAVHGALLARAHGATAKPGYLVSLREIDLHVQRIDDLPEALSVMAERLLHTANSWQYTFRIEHEGTIVASGRAAVLLRDP